MYALGAGYFKGAGAKDAAEAVVWLRKAARLGVGEARTILAQLGG
jgi:TPR repeat protein